MALTVDDIIIRTELLPGDLGYIIYMHGVLYAYEYGYSVSFESYVAAGLHEFYAHYDPSKDNVWLAEHDNKIIGLIVLMHRPDNAAQLRYFLISPEYRGIGLGKKLMQLFMDSLIEKEYASAYLLTTPELRAAAHLYKHFGFQLINDNLVKDNGEVLNFQRYVFRVG